jgi:uncharacterized protein YifE (UPF0438 family)
MSDIRQRIEEKEAEQERLWQKYEHKMEECLEVFALYSAVTQEVAELRVEEYQAIVKGMDKN